MMDKDPRARCDYCGRFLGETNTARSVEVVPQDYWNGPDERLICQKCDTRKERK